MSEFVIGAMVGGVSGIAAGYLAWKKNHVCQFDQNHETGDNQSN